MKQAVTINFPAPLPAEVPCPICTDEKKNSNGCKGCDFTGNIKITVDAKIPIQRGLIIKYVAENMPSVASELSRHYGLVPDVQTEDMIQIDEKEYEIVKISSLGGVIWVANRVDKWESPRYFKSLKDYKSFRNGWHGE